MKEKVYIVILIGLVLFMSGSDVKPVKSDVNKANFGPQISFKGRIVFQSNYDGDNEIYLMTKEGIKQLTDNNWSDEYPRWSPDGDKIAYSANPRGNYDIFIMDSDGSNINSLTSFSSDEKTPSWFPDGKRIVYGKKVKKFLRSKISLYWVNIHSKQSKRLMPDYSKIHAIPDVSPTSQLITFTGKKLRGWDVAMYTKQNKEVKFLENTGGSCRARFSNSGEKLAYVSSGDIWIMDPDGSHKMRMTKRDETHDYFPSWSPDDKWIVFNSSHQHSHDGDWKLFLLNVNNKKCVLLFDSPGNDIFPDWHK